MHITRSRLLITLVVIALASSTLWVRTSNATRLIVWEPVNETPTTVTAPNVGINAGEPETPGNQSPPPTQNRYQSNQSRGEASAPAGRPALGLWEWISRIWFARFPGFAL